MERIKQLDSIRGLAAITVLINHYLNVLPAIREFTLRNSDYELLNIIKYTPLHIFWAGQAAVFLFFVLSGYVLSLPFYQGKEYFSYESYIIRRFCRIYIPYIVSVLVAILGNLFLSKGGIDQLSAWFNSVWELPLRWDLVIDHFLFIGNFENGKLNPIYWSLVHEMRISIIFPFLMYFVLRWKWYFSLAMGCIFLSVGYEFIRNPYVNTLFYVFMFVVGALLAKHQITLTQRVKKLSRKTKLAILILGVLLYTYEHWIRGIAISLNSGFLTKIITIGVFTTVGCAIIIILSLSSNTLSNVLLKKTLKFLGKISYSIYLYHALALFSFTYLLYDMVSIPVIWIISLVVALCAASVSYYIVEEPAIRLGKHLSKIIDRKATFIKLTLKPNDSKPQRI